MSRYISTKGLRGVLFAGLFVSLLLGNTVVLAQTSDRPLSSLSEKDLFKKGEKDYKAGHLEDAREALMVGLEKRKKQHKKYTPLLEKINIELSDREVAKGEPACGKMDLQTCEKQIAAAKTFAVTPRVHTLEGQLNAAVGELKQKFDAAVKLSDNGQPESALTQLESLKPFAPYIPDLDAGIERAKETYGQKLVSEGNALIQQRKWDDASSRFKKAMEYAKDDAAATAGLDRIERGRKAYELFNAAINQQTSGNYPEAFRALQSAVALYPGEKSIETMKAQMELEWRQQLDMEIPALLENATDFKSTRDAVYRIEEAGALLPEPPDAVKYLPQAKELFGANSLQRSAELEAIVDYSRIATALALRLNAQKLMPQGTVKAEELKNLAAIFNRKRASQILIAVDNLCAASDSFIQTLYARTKNVLENLGLPDLKIRTIEEYKISPDEDTQFQDLRPDRKSATVQLTIGAAKYLSERRSSENPIEMTSQYVSGTEKVPNPEYQRVQAEVDKIRKALDARKKRDKPTPEGWTDLTYQQKLAELKGIERTITRDKISDYTYQKYEHKQQTAVEITVTLRDYFSRESFANDTIDFHEEKEATEIVGVRPKDVNSLMNEPVRLPSTEQVLREAERTVLEKLEEKINAIVPIYTKRFFNEAEKAFKAGRVDDAVEYYLCYWVFTRGKLDDTQKNRIAGIVKREIGFDLFKQNDTLLSMSISQ